MAVAFECLGKLFLQFITGFLHIFVTPATSSSSGGIFGGVFEIINITAYIEIFKNFSPSLNAGGWVVVIIGMLLILALIGALIWLAVHFISKLFRRYFTKKPLNDDLIAEINRLNKELAYAQRKGFIAGGALMGVVSAVLAFLGCDWVLSGWADSMGAVYLGIAAYVAIIAYFIWHSRRADINE